MGNEMLRRQAATQATEVRYRGHLLDIKARNDCMHMALSHAKAMGVKVPRVPPLRGWKSSLRVMAQMGFTTMADVMDHCGFERIPPAAMLMGDIAWRGVPDDAEEFSADPARMGGLLVCVGPHKLMGWFANPETQGKMVVMDMSFDQLDAAWRLCPKSSQ